MLILMTLRLSWPTVHKLRWPALIISWLAWPWLPWGGYLAGLDCERFNHGGHSPGLGTFDHLRYSNYPFVFMVVAAAVAIIFLILDTATVVGLQQNPPDKNVQD